MRIESIRQAEHLGSVKIHGVRRILELDSGSRQGASGKSGSEAQRIDKGDIAAIEGKMAIVLPVKSEDPKVFEGVLAGVPHDCLPIIVSNSQRGEIDHFKSEQDILERFCQATQRQAIIVHQRDPFLARAIECAGYPEILDEDGFIRHGKSEGMLTGLFLAAMMGKEYIGYIDTDNFIPGAVWEYVKHYAIGFYLSTSPYTMVRILWRYKPKMLGELYFKKWGRVSELTNKHLNHFLSTKGRFETEIIKTANAGEHAMSIDLAMRLNYASGYAIETQELISILEQFGGLLPIADRTIAEKGVDIIQTETINPHLHEEREDSEHLYRDMLIPSLSVIYHSQACEESTRELIRNQIAEIEGLKLEEDVPQVTLLPPPQKADLARFAGELADQLNDISIPHGWMMAEKQTIHGTSSAAHKVVYTDLDGTLLHPVSNSYAPALTALRQLQERQIPVIFCSAKTHAEQTELRRELEVKDPFIVENGGAIFVPKDYFRLPFTYTKANQVEYVIELGALYDDIKQRLKLVAESGPGRFTTFGDMSIEEIAQVSGLNLRMAQLAKEREYSETVVMQGDKRETESVLDAITKQGLSWVFGGRFYEVSLGADKGKAVKILNELYRMNYGQIVTYGLGDGQNDAPLLAAVHHALLVQNADKRWSNLKVKDPIKVKDIGPSGWSRAVSEWVLKSP
ncbi:MAG: bifunctional mannosyl-3-phosphoglycerate synthase/mannosyl-3 phosphoglycerate phosphatase [Dehalococcoidia bacterium]|nr:bifunctional mannosyl-3-phosphoglycerate synthase/mannosyl-3 phosphoglycerate phosphatase [Dehalococcoidia bacterium]